MKDNSYYWFPTLIIVIVFIIARAGAIYSAEQERAKQVQTYLENNPTVYLDGVVVDPNNLVLEAYLCEYDEERNVLKLVRNQNKNYTTNY